MQSKSDIKSGAGQELLDLLKTPSAAHAGRDEDAEFLATKDAFRDLEKLTKNIALYGLEHQSTLQFLSRVHDSLRKAIPENGCLDIVVGPYEFTLREMPVLENPSPERNFIYQLYLDGIRRLRFFPHMTREELGRFVRILQTDWDDTRLFEDDMVTLLWSARLDGIRYSVLDNFAEDIRDGDDQVYTVSGVVEQVLARGIFDASDVPGLDDGSSRRLKRVDLGQVEMSGGDLESFSEVIFAMDEEDFRYLRTVVHTTGREKLEKFIEILFKVHLIQEIGEEQRRGRITALFDRIADLLLDRSDIGELERLLRTIRRLKGPAERVIRENVLAIEHIVDHWSAQAFIDRVTIGLKRDEFHYVPSVIAICQLLSNRAAPHLARVCGRIENSEIRAQVWNVVRQKLGGQAREVAALLTDAQPQHAHEIFQVLRTEHDPDDLLFAVERAMDNPNPKVRLEGLSQLPSPPFDAALTLVMRALNDGAKSVRSRALHSLARVRKATVHERIMTCMNSPAYAQYALDEKRRFAAAAALTGGDSRRWVEQFSAKGMLSSKVRDEDRHCAAVALGIRLQTDASALLEKEANRRLKSPLVAEAARWALQHMEAERSVRTEQLHALFFRGELVSAPGAVS